MNGTQLLLTHCSLVTQYGINELGSIIGSGNGLSPVRRLAISWTSADLLSIGTLGVNFSEIW